MLNYLVKFEDDFGRHGNIEGLFVLNEKELAYLKSKEKICFGEALGKHSCVTVLINDKTFKVVSENQEFIDQLMEVIGSDHISGYNPLNYIDQFDDWETLNA